MAEKLVKEGHEVYGVVRRVANRNMAVLGNLLNDITLLSGDITDYVSISIRILPRRSGGIPT